MKGRFFSSAQLALFERDGFIVVRGLFSPVETAALSEHIDALVRRGPVEGREMFYYEDSLLEKGGRVLSRIENFAQHDDRLRALVADRRLAGASSELLNDEAVLFKDKINFKPPGGGGFAPHQDIQPGWDDYAPYFLSVLVAIDPSTAANGCLELSAGHHKKGLLGEKWKPLTEEQLEGVRFEACPMEPGDAAFFDCFVPHQSGPNLTAGPRRNLYLTFNRASDGEMRERYFSDKRKSYPPDNEREPGKNYVFKV